MTITLSDKEGIDEYLQFLADKLVKRHSCHGTPPVYAYEGMFGHLYLEASIS